MPSSIQGLNPRFRCQLLLELWVFPLSPFGMNIDCVNLWQSAFPKHDGNLFEWVGTIEGPTETVRVPLDYLFLLINIFFKVYAGLTYKIAISFPPNYPYVAPTIKFDPPCCYHPNVDITSGAICLDILQVSLLLACDEASSSELFNRTSGRLCIACRPSCSHCSPCLVVRLSMLRWLNSG